VATSPSRITVTWNASSGDIGCSGLAPYRLFRGSTLIAITGATTAFDNSLAANTQYTYTVYADDNAGNTSGPSSTASATTWPAVVANLSTTGWLWIKRGANAPKIDPPVVCTGSGGSGSGYTYAWQRVSGDGSTTAVNPTGSSTRWNRSVPDSPDTSYISTWRCVVTDSGGNTNPVQSTVTVEFTRRSLQ
jgi:hypothetical protein